MARPHFIQLAQYQNSGLITTCRHGVVHLTWLNLTVRLHEPDFRRLVRLLERGTALSDPAPIHDGEMAAAFEGDAYRVTVANMELILAPADFISLSRMAMEAGRRLEEIAGSEAWDEPEPIPWTRPQELSPPRFSSN